MPYFIEATLLHFFTFIVFTLARKQREAIRNNLKTIHHDLSFCEGYVGAYLVFANFGWSYIDSLRVRLGQNIITWDTQGTEHFEKIRNGKDAAMIFTTHTGNYDLAAALFASEFGRPLHTVRIPERTPELQAIREKELTTDSQKSSYFQVHYNKEGGLLGVELAKLLSEGELLAIQCDRVVSSVVELTVPLAKTRQTFRIPKGPMTLASFSKSPCYPLFIIRERRRHYRIIFEHPLEVTTDHENPRKKPREMDYAKAWVERLMAFLQTHSHQWFVFEDAFTQQK